MLVSCTEVWYASKSLHLYSPHCSFCPAGNLGFVIYKELEDVDANLGSRVEFSIVVGFNAKVTLYGFHRDGRLAGISNSGPVADIDNVQLGGDNNDQVESMITCTVANTDGVERIFNSTLILQGMQCRAPNAVYCTLVWH